MSSFLQKKIFKKTNLDQNLSFIYGVGPKTSKLICEKFGYNPRIIFSQLREEQLNKLFSYIETNFPMIETNLKINKLNNRNFLIKLKNRKAIRHKYGLPVRGQRTHTNGKTKSKIKL